MSYKRAIPANILKEITSLQKVKDNWRNVFYIGFDYAVIAASIAVPVVLYMNLGLTWWVALVYLVAVVLIGSRQRALMNLVHQASHAKLFKNRRANDWAGKIFVAYPLLTSLWAYRAAHRDHHGWLWKEQEEKKPGDPKLVRYRKLGLGSPPKGKLRFYGRHVVKPMLLWHAVHNIVSALSWKDEPRSETLARVGFWAILITVILTTGLMAEFLLFWLIPLCASFQVIRYFGEMAEHAGLQSDDPWQNTRSWTSSFPVRWLLAPHTDSYHLAHHLFPLVPHYKLKEAHRLLMQVPEYARGHHCDGFFIPRRVDAPSVVQDMRKP